MGLFRWILCNTRDGQAHQEGWHCWKIWHTLWCLSQKDCEEDGNLPAQQIHMWFLWKGLHEETSCGNLVVLQVQEGCCRWSLGLQHNCCRSNEVCHPSSEGNEGTVMCE